MITRQEKNKEAVMDLEKEEKIIKNKKLIKRVLLIFSIILFIVISFFSYARYIGTYGLIVNEYKIQNNKIPESFNGFKIIHLSDILYKSTVSKKDLNRIKNKINELKPDIIVFTGNLFNDVEITKKDVKTMKKFLNGLNASIGIYAIKGNLDYYSYYDDVIKDTKIILLENTYTEIYYKDYTPILLTGTNSSIQKDNDYNKSFSYNDKDNIYTISLIHEPENINKIINNKPDLLLAGHSLNGLIRFPLIGGLIKLDGVNEYINSKYEINNSKIFISNGIGCYKYNFRLNNHPSINFYRLSTDKK